MVTPDPRRGDEPNREDSKLPEINGSAPQPDDDEQPTRDDDDGAPAGQHGPTASYGEG